jgi:predicted nucleotidyltransferase
VERRLEISLRAVVNHLNQHGYRYAIIGGIALSYWGVVRATQDVDIKVFVPDGDYPAIRTALQSAFPHPARPQLPANSLIVAVTISDVIVDFLLALPGYEELIVERAKTVDLGDWSVQISTAEDLIIQKVVAGRDKDWLDVEALLLEQFDHLDQAYIEDWLLQFAEALESPQLLKKYKQLYQRAQALR